MCFGSRTALPAYGGDAAEGEARLSQLEAKSMRIVHVRTGLACVSMLNTAMAGGRSKLAVDLELFERLLVNARGVTREDLRAICGMVGGIRDVPRFVSVIERERWTLAERDETGLHYDVDRVGRVSFEIGADESHMPVALASIVGKYVRELTMGRIVAYHRAHDATLPEPSGYHDPVTARFVAASEVLRRKLAILDACFSRNG